MNVRSFYTYFHTRNDTDEVFYIGKGKGDRAHEKWRSNPHWNRIVSKHGHTVHIVARWPTEDEAFTHERFLISCFRGMGVKLCNLTDGGEGPCGCKRSDETKAKQSASLKGHVCSLETRTKLAESARKNMTPEARSHLSAFHLGKKRPIDMCEKMSFAGKNRAPMSVETRIKMSAVMKERMRSPEARAKISAFHKGHLVSQETRAKISESHKFRSPVSLESRAKMSVSAKRYQARRTLNNQTMEVNV